MLSLRFIGSFAVFERYGPLAVLSTVKKGEFSQSKTLCAVKRLGNTPCHAWFLRSAALGSNVSFALSLRWK